MWYVCGFGRMHTKNLMQKWLNNTGEEDEGRVWEVGQSGDEHLGMLWTFEWSCRR